MIYIIDGYNVMHAIEDGAGIAATDLEEKRRDFVESVVGHAAISGDEVIVVFDSTAAKTPQSRRVPRTGVTLYFASATESADIIIGKLVQEYLHNTRERIKVVSGDWEVQKGAMQSRVERAAPRHYIADLKNIAKGLANTPEKDRIRWKLEHKLDVETLRKLERMRRGEQ
ncbi:MAG: NYN domain-containing protein [Thermoleophilia bacterium]